MMPPEKRSMKNGSTGSKTVTSAGLSRLLCDPPHGGSNTFVRRSFLCSVTPLGSWPRPNNECVLLTPAGSWPRPDNECVLLTPEGSQNIEVIMPARISTRRTAGRRAVVAPSTVKRRRDSPDHEWALYLTVRAASSYFLVIAQGDESNAQSSLSSRSRQRRNECQVC